MGKQSRDKRRNKEEEWQRAKERGREVSKESEVSRSALREMSKRRRRE